MAVRMTWWLAGFVVGAALGTAVVVMHASAELPEETIAAADEAHVEPAKLQGAVVSTGLPPREYLYMTGELQRPLPPVRAVWDRLAACESGGDWHSVRNPIYKGGLQFDQGTWLRHGGAVYAPRADLATREQQVVIAERTLAAQGWGAWPVCSRRLGLR